jgi:hypothetical protein
MSRAPMSEVSKTTKTSAKSKSKLGKRKPTNSTAKPSNPRVRKIKESQNIDDIVNSSKWEQI